MQEENKNGKKEETTHVTSIADIEKETGEEIQVPDEEELVAKANSSLVANLTELEKLFGQLSSKEKTRVLIATLSLPTNGLPVKIKTDNGKKAFALGQRAITDKFIIFQNDINKKIKEHKESLNNENKGDENGKQSEQPEQQSE